MGGIAVLIPAYNPDHKLIELVQDLVMNHFKFVVVVNDGSSDDHKPIFDQISKHPECHIKTHSVNLGKGRAIKTGLNYIYLKLSHLEGVVTVDADGQHLVKDIISVKEAFFQNTDKLIIGKRTFSKEIPFRSYFGNVMTKYVFMFFVGKKINDTQSGLRAFSLKHVPHLLKLFGERYEYETNVLISTKVKSIDIIEVPIETIYSDNNKSSHFNPIRDSMTIYFLIIRFLFSSISASLVDLIIYSFIYIIADNILMSIVIARVISSNLNFVFNKNFVFNIRGRFLNSYWKYYLLVVIICALSYISINFLMSHFGINAIIAKIIVETILFIASFSIQREIVFNKSSD